MYGSSHGGIESIIIVSVSALSIGITLLVNPGLLPFDQLMGIESLPFYFPLMGIYKMIMAIIVQIGLTILVLQTFLNNDIKYLTAALIIHFILDFIALLSLRFNFIWADYNNRSWGMFWLLCKGFT